MTLASFILAFILWMDPLMNHINDEDPFTRVERLKEISSDIASVCSDPNQKPIFSGPNARLKTCLLIASVARSESGFKYSIDSGKETGDGGRSICIMQVQHGKNELLHPPIDRLKDRKVCIAAGLNVLRTSKCNDGTDLTQMLRAYVNGSCNPLDDPKKDAVVVRTATADAAGYALFIKQNKRLPQFKELSVTREQDAENVATAEPNANVEKVQN